jgi:hypothetical protein
VSQPHRRRLWLSYSHPTLRERSHKHEAYGIVGRYFHNLGYEVSHARLRRAKHMR